MIATAQPPAGGTGRRPDVIERTLARTAQTDIPAALAAARDELLPYRQPVLARREVRYVGEPVVVVFATSAYLAEDAAERVVLEIEQLPVHLDPDATPVEWVDSEQATWAAGLPGTLSAQDSEATTFVTEYGDVDTAAVVVRFDGGALGVISNARYNGRGYDCRLEVHGFEDTVVAGWDHGVPMRNVDSRLGDSGFPTGMPHHFFMDRFTEAFRTELAAFVDVVRGGPVQGATVADAVEVAWIAEAATESLRRGTPVRISEVRR